MTNKNIRFSTLFTPDQVICCSSDNRHDNKIEHIIHQLAAQIGAVEQSIDIEAAYRLLLYREACSFTPIQPDVTVVHIRTEGLKQLRIAIAVSREGLNCSSEQYGFKSVTEENKLVNMAVLMMAPDDDPASYLRAVAALKEICQQEGFVKELLKLNHCDEIWKAFDKTGEVLPDYAEARHIMHTDFSHLHVNDNLSVAIDLFCKQNSGEFPVVDTDGDLIGVVSEEELIRLCLPDYITWMNDLSPILNFEPFAEILQREKNMPVMEIMEFSDRYVTIDESTPAIQVARLMMRREVQQVFVVRQNKLTGIISIHDLIRKVLRA